MDTKCTCPGDRLVILFPEHSLKDVMYYRLSAQPAQPLNVNTTAVVSVHNFTRETPTPYISRVTQDQ